MVAAYEVRDDDPLPGIPRGPQLWIGTPGGSGVGSTALAISLDGHFNGAADQQADAATSLFEALLALERAQANAVDARQRRD